MTLSWDALEARLARPPERPLPGQLAISVGHIGHHTFEGPGLWCQAEDFGVPCGKHRDEHQHVEDNQR